MGDRHKPPRQIGNGLRPADGQLARLIVTVPVVMTMRIVASGWAALTGRIWRHSTAGLAVVAAACLVVAQLDERVGDGHPQFRGERGIVCGPVREEGLKAWLRSVMVLCHVTYATAGAASALSPGVWPRAIRP